MTPEILLNCYLFYVNIFRTTSNRLSGEFRLASDMVPDKGTHYQELPILPHFTQSMSCCHPKYIHVIVDNKMVLLRQHVIKAEPQDQENQFHLSVM